MRRAPCRYPSLQLRARSRSSPSRRVSARRHVAPRSHRSGFCPVPWRPTDVTAGGNEGCGATSLARISSIRSEMSLRPLRKRAPSRGLVPLGAPSGDREICPPVRHPRRAKVHMPRPVTTVIALADASASRSGNHSIILVGSRGRPAQYGRNVRTLVVDLMLSPGHAGIRLAATVAPSSQQASRSFAPDVPSTVTGSCNRFHFRPATMVSTLRTAPVVSEPPWTYKGVRPTPTGSLDRSTGRR